MFEASPQSRKDAEAAMMWNNEPLEKVSDDRLITMYESLQRYTESSIDLRDSGSATHGTDEEGAPKEYPERQKGVEDRVEKNFATLNAIREEIEKRHRERGLALPPTMEEGGKEKSE